MFEFSSETPSKVVLTATIPIKPDWRSSPLVWTPERKEFQARRVFLVCTVTQTGRQSMRFYPLRKDDRFPPAFVLVGHDHPLLNEKGTHIFFRHANFLIIRPLHAVFYKAKWSLEREEFEWLPQNLLTLIKHCYFQDLISDEVLEVAEKHFERLGKLIVLAEESTNQGEAGAAIKGAFRLCEELFRIIREEVGLR